MSGGTRLRIGLDFDNTIISYAGLFRELALSRDWVPPETPPSKEAVKRRLIEEDGNDLRWQRLQADAYGERLLTVDPAPGCLEFVRKAAEDGHELFIVSHKTERSNFDPTVELRKWAWDWLRKNGFLSEAGIREKNVRFAATRDEKVSIIASLELDLFVDDMLVVLEHAAFPGSSQPVHYRAPSGLSDEPPAPPGVLRTSSWAEVGRLVDAISETGPAPYRAVTRGLGSRPVEIGPAGPAGNNRLLKLTLEDGKDVVLKRYLLDPRDPRRRSAAEHRALKLLRGNGLRNVPEPLHHDEAAGFALLSYVAGKPLRGEPVTAEHVRQAVSFLGRLGDLHLKTLDEDIPEGADSRRCLADFVRHVERRWAGVREGASDAPSGKAAAELLDRKVLPVKRRIIETFGERAAALGVDPEEPVPAAERILSPSDFGFHNAVLAPDGRVHFMDFEYFGRDDPAKLVADFVHHAGQDLSWELKKLFLESFHAAFSRKESFLLRLRLVIDLIGLEWVLIILNVLAPESLARRRFSRPEADAAELVARRLSLAEERLEKMSEYVSAGPYVTVPEFSPLLKP